MKRIFVLVIVILLIFVYGLNAGEWKQVSEPVALPGHLNPTQILVNDNNVYVIELPEISIYSQGDLKLKKRFGKAGEGPKEFKLRSPFQAVSLRAHLDSAATSSRLLVTSMGKISIFSGEGDFIKEIKNKEYFTEPQFLGDKFVARRLKLEDNVRYSRLEMCDASFNILKTILRKKSFFVERGGDRTDWYLFSVTMPTSATFEGKIFFAGNEKDFIVEAFDEKGDKRFTIKREYAFVPFTEADKKKVLQRYWDNPTSRAEYEAWKQILIFPKQFPAVRDIFVDHETLYIRTYKKENGNTEFFVYTTDGKFKERVFLPIKESNSRYKFPFLRDSAPFAFWKGKLYQLVDNEDEETYELLVYAPAVVKP